MNETQRINKDAQESIQQDRLAVVESLLTAMREIALEIGGEELVDKVAQVTPSRGIWPSPEALKVLDDFQKGSVELVMIRMTEIEKAAREREREEMRKSRLKMYGNAILNGFARSLNIFDGSSENTRN